MVQVVAAMGHHFVLVSFNDRSTFLTFSPPYRPTLITWASLRFKVRKVGEHRLLLAGPSDRVGSTPYRNDTSSH